MISSFYIHSDSYPIDSRLWRHKLYNFLNNILSLQMEQISDFPVSCLYYEHALYNLNFPKHIHDTLTTQLEKIKQEIHGMLNLQRTNAFSEA